MLDDDEDTEAVESEEEDSQEVQVAEDTEVMDGDSDDEDPEEIQAVAEIGVMEEDTDVTTEQVMEAVLGLAVDEGAEADTEGQSEDDDPSEGWETEAQAEEPVVDTTGGSDLYLPALTTERAPTPPPLPVSSPDSFEELTPEPQQTEDAPPVDPSTPPHVPIPGIPICVHNWAMDRVYENMAVVEGRLAESRAELTAERAARMELLQTIRAERQGGEGSRSRRYIRRRLTRIELRARVAVRTLPTDGAGRVSRVDAEEIFRHAMLRARALARADDRSG
jgi:hypothetical protein